MTRDEFDKIKKAHDEIHQGRAGHWFDPGEYEYLIKQFFLEKVPKLLEAAEKGLTDDDPTGSSVP